MGQREKQQLSEIFAHRVTSILPFGLTRMWNYRTGTELEECEKETSAVRSLVGIDVKGLSHC
jgi:hypothetical protein